VSYALCLLAIPLHEIGRWRQVGQQFLQGIDTADHLQQQQKRSKRDVVGTSALKFVNGGQADAALLCNFPLSEIAAQPVFPEPASEQPDQFWC